MVIFLKNDTKSKEMVTVVYSKITNGVKRMLNLGWESVVNYIHGLKSQSFLITTLTLSYIQSSFGLAYLFNEI